MEINELQFKLLQKQIKELSSYLGRVHQYHLGAKPSFMHRNHWNEINDALHNASQQAAICDATAKRIEVHRQDIPGRMPYVWAVPWKTSDVGNKK